MQQRLHPMEAIAKREDFFYMRLDEVPDTIMLPL